MDPIESDHLLNPKSGSSPSPSPSPRNNNNNNRILTLLLEPIEWVRTLSSQLNPSLIIGIILIYALSHGFSGSFFKLSSDFYWKDVHRLNPSTVQLFWGFYYIPWVLKPLWGLLTDVFPIAGYRRRPYFLIAGLIGGVSVISLSLIRDLPAAVALGWMVGFKAGMAIGEVTIDACIARKSIEVRSLAADMQSLRGFSSSAGSLLGYFLSGVFVHNLGPQEALGLLTVSPAAMLVMGVVMYELKVASRDQGSSHKHKKWAGVEKLKGAVGDMAKTIRRPEVWKPTLYIYLSLALSISAHEGLFYWYTNPSPAGPSFSQEMVGMMYAVGALASIVGVLIYHKFLKDVPFRTLLFSAQLLHGLSGMLDVVFVLRWNLILGIPDSVFIILDECVTNVIARVRWTPMLVLSTRLCPVGIEGTFFALLMCIDSMGTLSAKWAGGLVLHLFHVSRTDFTNLWLVVLLRNLLRLATLGLVFLIPRGDRYDEFIPSDILSKRRSTSRKIGDDDDDDDKTTAELVPLKQSGAIEREA